MSNALFQIQRANFFFPSWFSSGAKDVIKRILDPNPLTVSSESLASFRLCIVVLDVSE